MENQRSRRSVSVQRVFDDFALDGLHPSPAALEDAADYVEGRNTLDEIIQRVVRRHTRG